MMNFNTDVSNFWEFSAEGRYPVAESNEAYKLGVNYLIYASPLSGPTLNRDLSWPRPSIPPFPLSNPPTTSRWPTG